MKKQTAKKRQDEIKESIYDILGHGVQFDIDCIMNLMIANKNIPAKERVKNLKTRLEALETLLDELINERPITTINYKNS